MKFTRKSIFILIFAMIFLYSSAISAFAAQSVEYTTNGAANNYVAGSVLVLYGKVLEGGSAVPNASVTVDIKDAASKVIYYGILKTDNSGYFKTNFTIPTGVSGDMRIIIKTLDGEKVNAVYSLDTPSSLLFTGYTTVGYKAGESVKTIPYTTSKLGLVFSGNVNYFNNKNNNLDLASLGKNVRNMDCIDLYEKTSSGSYTHVSSSLEMVTSDAGGGNDIVSGITYLSGIASGDKKNERKDILYVVPSSSLKASTTYKVIIDKDLSANSSATLGTNVEVFFTTSAQASSSGGGGGAVSSPSTLPTVKADSVGKVTVGESLSSVAVDSLKAANLLKDSANKALSLDLSDLTSNAQKQIDVTLPANILAEAKTQDKPVVLNYGDYVMVIPPGSLPSDKELVISAKEAAKTAEENKPSNMNGLKTFEFSAKDKSGNKVEFLNNLNLEFDVPAGTTNPQRLCVYYIDEKTGEWVYSGGRIVNGKLTFSPTHYSTYVVAESTKTFDDLSAHWSKDYVEAMIARQIVKGATEKEFRPDKSITRAEFAVMVSRALALKETGKTPVSFEDVKQSDWYFSEISKAATAGIVTGNAGKFRPNDNISRQEMAAIISRALDYSKKQTTSSDQLNFKDNASISSWAKDSILKVYGLKIMSGYPDGNFSPTKLSTRAESAKTLKAFMDVSGL